MTRLIDNIEKYYPVAWVILFFVSYLVFFPENWMITDAYNYVNRAIAFASGQDSLFAVDFHSGENISLIPAPYNTGTSAFQAIPISLFGKWAVFLAPLFQVILSVLLLSAAIKRNSYSVMALSILGCSLALLFFSRSLMSCMPSFLLVSVAVFLFYREKLENVHAFSLGFLAVFSLWFRESNVFLIAPFVIYLLYKEPKRVWAIFVGFLLGSSPKIIMDKWVYGKYWFSSASSGFSASSIIDHIPEYAIILMILIPSSVIFIALYRGKADKTVQVASAAFILLYLSYNYTAVEFSGLLKGSFLTSRFMIPLLPIVVICAAEVISSRKIFQKLMIPIVLLSLITIPASQYVFGKMYQDHEQAASKLGEIMEGKNVFLDLSGYTNIIRYYNPLTIKSPKISSIQHLKNLQSIAEDERIIISRSSASEEKTMRADSLYLLIEDLPIEKLETVKIDELNWLEVYGRR